MRKNLAVGHSTFASICVGRFTLYSMSMEAINKMLPFIFSGERRGRPRLRHAHRVDALQAWILPAQSSRR